MKSIVCITVLVFIFSCGHDASKNSSEDTATYGSIRIAADEAFKPIVESELDVFKSFYIHADIKPTYSTESEAIKLLLQDSVRLVVSSRELLATEKAYFDQLKLFPRVNKISIDGVALIVNLQNKDSLVSLEQLRAVFSGNSSLYTKIVFDNSNSSNLRFIKERFNLTTISSSVFSAGSNKAVVDFVKNDKKTLGVIGASWISDSDDSTSKVFTNSIRVVAITTVTSNPVYPDDYFQPYQAYVATGQYPLVRSLYIISREARVGLGTGFASFVMSDQGQRIILKAGMVPANVPLRIVKTTKNQP